MTWQYQGKEFTEDCIDDHFGFVYLITHISSGRKYIGKKFFSKAGYKQVKGKRKRIRKTNDWKKYWGSNKELQEEIKINGEDQYQREILYLCKTRSECSYYETYEIFVRHALLSMDFYNSWVTCKIRKDHLIKVNTDTYKKNDEKPW
jgi:hypothetical protein